MLIPPLPADEDLRLENLRKYEILDTAAEQDYDDITRLASHLCGTPISLISVLDANRQWFKSQVGLPVGQTPREISFCAHAILGNELFVVSDARKDKRFHDNPFVTDSPNIRFYAGTPLVTPEGHALGTLCVIDRVPRELTTQQADGLRALGRQVMSQLMLRRSVNALDASERFARSTVDALTAHIAILDEAGTIIAVNRAWREFAQRNPPVPSVFAMGANYLAVCESATGKCSEEAAAVAAGIRAVLAGERDVFTLEYPCHSPTERRWFVARVSRFASDGPTRAVVSHENITARRQAEDRLRHDSLHDALTGLPNRVLFADRVERALQRVKRDPTCHFAVLFIDLDRFKVINDSLGHAAGDKLLTEISERLQTCVRGTDSVGRAPAGHDEELHGERTVARMGGDEFTILLDELRDPEDAARVAARVLRAVARPVEFAGHQLTTTASIGVVNGSPSYPGSSELLRDADAAMYRAKTSGKDRYALFDSSMHEKALARLGLENDLRHALELGELLLHYQPIVSLSTRRLEGFEALVRWNRGGKLVSPADFIPVAEDTGLIVPLGAWVLEEACRQMAAWGVASAAQGLSMSVNLSRKQLSDVKLVPHLEQVLRETGLDPSSLRLEITESVLMDDTEAAKVTLSCIKAAGAKLAMDDFGTGYSSLSCLHKFPIDVLKVDRSFIQNLEGRRDTAAVVQAIVDLAHNLDMRVVAEGLETAEQVAFLQALDCDSGQGYYFARPLTAEAAERFLATGIMPRDAA